MVMKISYYVAIQTLKICDSYCGVVRIPWFNVEWKLGSIKNNNCVSMKVVFVCVVLPNNVVLYNVNACSSYTDV